MSVSDSLNVLLEYKPWISNTYHINGTIGSDFNLSAWRFQFQSFYLLYLNANHSYVCYEYHSSNLHTLNIIQSTKLHVCQFALHSSSPNLMAKYNMYIQYTASLHMHDCSISFSIISNTIRSNRKIIHNKIVTAAQTDNMWCIVHTQPWWCCVLIELM